MNQYELLFIVDTRLAEEELSALQERITGMIGGNKGEIVSSETMGVRRLAYPIKKLDEGRYILVIFKADAESITPLDKQLRVLQQIVRFIIVRQEA